ncbi:MAG: DMT family transporter [Anaerolineae bacterium]|jgi:drug/metabolite transporter (DMT)-like permease
MGSEWLAVIFGLGAAFAWGAGDFTGGVATQRSNVYSVVFLSHLVGLALVAGLAVFLAEPIPPVADLVAGGIAGIGGSIGVAALYRGLARGPMGIVAPVAAIVTAAGPVIYGLVVEGVPAVQQMVGFGLALVAVWLISRTGDGGPVQATDLVLPVLAGLGFSVYLIFIDQASETTVLWPLVAVRVTSAIFIVIVGLLARQNPGAAAGQLPLIVLLGVSDVTGNALYALATQLGRLDIAAVLSSLYPAATVLLAWSILKERITRWQWLGIASALLAIVFIAS